MAKYIDVSKVTIPKDFFNDLNVPKLLNWLNSQPEADAISMAVHQQVRWERDIAIGQLEEYGICFGEKKKDLMEVVRCENCAFSNKQIEFKNLYVFLLNLYILLLLPYFSNKKDPFRKERVFFQNLIKK